MVNAKREVSLIGILILLLGVSVFAQGSPGNTEKNPGSGSSGDGLKQQEQKPEYLSGQGDACRRKGDVYLQTGDPHQAIKMYEEALALFEKAGDLAKQALAYESKANACWGIGDNKKAVEAYRGAMDLYEKNNETAHQGRMAKNIGDIYYREDNYGEALRWYDKALGCYADENVNNLRGQFDIYLANGYIFQKLGNPEKSKEMFDKAQDILMQMQGKLDKQDSRYKEWRDKPDQYKKHLEKSGDWKWLGQEYLWKGHQYTGLMAATSAAGAPNPPDYEKALEMYSQAQKYFENVDDLDGIGEVHLYKGQVYVETGRYDDALNHYDEALRLAEKTGNILTLSSVYQGKARLYEKTDKPGNVLEQYDLLLAVYQKIHDLQGESDTLFDKAVLLNKMGRKDEAADSFEKSIKSLETFRRQTAYPELKKTFFQRYYRRYEEIALFMLENNYNEKGYRCVEEMKARLFRDRLSENKTQLEEGEKGIDKILKSKRSVLILELSGLAKQMFEATQKKSGELENLRAKYRQKEKEFDDLLIKIRVKNPQYASVYYPEPVTVTTLQKEILKEEELLLHYFVTAEKVYVFLISKEDFQVKTLDIKRDDIDKLVTDYLCPFYKGCLKTEEEKKRRLPKKMVSNWLIDHGITIYQSIFKPLEPWLKGKKEIMIIPDGELATVPIEAFVIDNSKPDQPVYLLEKYRVKYIQSTSVLEFLRKHPGSKSPTNGFIGFGNPVYDYKNFKQGKTEYDGEGSSGDKNVFWGCLPGSGVEVEAIDGLFKNMNQRSCVYLRKDATEEKAKSTDLKDFAYIHFSCHGVLGEGYQGLVLSQIPAAPGKEPNEDGYLTLEEIMKCHYNAKLVVLSACETGKGNLEQGEGVTGLTRAVMYAGTPAVMVSLWSVDQYGTKDLLIRFYRDMLEKGMGKEEALRQAKLEMIKGGTYSSPYYWSAFVMYGE